MSRVQLYCKSAVHRGQSFANSLPYCTLATGFCCHLKATDKRLKRVLVLNRLV